MRSEELEACSLSVVSISRDESNQNPYGAEVSQTTEETTVSVECRAEAATLCQHR